MMKRLRGLVLSLALAVLLARAAQAHAQDAHPDGLAPGGAGPEPIDTTRLDVARLPPEAARSVGITRELYDRGLFLEAQLGGLTFVGDARRVSHAGPRLAIALGYELAAWCSLLLTVEGSQHQTRNRPPPSHTSYELVGGSLGARFTVPLGVAPSLWLAGLVGTLWSSGDVLRGLDFRDAFKLGLAYGGELGFDWHLAARHHSLGLLAGVRHLPALARDEFTLGLYGAGYLRYVF